MNEMVEKIRKLIQPLLDQAQIYLVDMELRGQPNNQVLSIYLDTETGITLQQIADTTREIEGILDLEDPIPGKYRLDVSSPGADRPLKEGWQFRKNLGRELQVIILEDERTLEKFGRLVEVQTDAITLQQKNQTFKIPLSQIKKATVKLNW